MSGKKDRQVGFTIVELLIVIVVIAILAAISIVAYNGIQQRAQNTQTVSALTAWIKALNSYRIEHGAYPGYWTCLGDEYKYGPSGADASGDAQCRQDTAGSGITEVSAFENLMRPYLGGSLPTPAMVTAKSSDTVWRRGLSFAPTGGDGTLSYITAAYSGSIDCPSVSGVEFASKSVWGGNTYCLHVIGHTTDPL